MSKANTEQLKGIQHQGGVLLSAGAGSGKTFVLVEHVIYLIKKIHQDSPDLIVFEHKLRQFFSSMVMMTFTNKAAGEMSIRLALALKTLKDETQDEMWKIAEDQISWLQITTIDGFCRKLISQGFFPDIPQDIEVISEVKRIKMVEDLMDQWFEEKKLEGKLGEVFKREKRALRESLSQVFLNPETRLSWLEFSSDDLSRASLERVVRQSYLLNHIDEALSVVFDFVSTEIDKMTSFEKVIQQFQSNCGRELSHLDDIKTWSDFFSNLGTLRGETPKKKTPLHEQAHSALKNLRTWAQDWHEGLSDYEQHADEYHDWVLSCQELFLWINERLKVTEGLTFGDIEFYVATGLQNAQLKRAVQERYQYFIVDEFQDTSHLQFEIIQHLIDHDFNRLFCVGDPKQAIYGFRGGELSVFETCRNKMKNFFSLKMNYRSQREIIDFNNTLFKSILSAGLSFEGVDHFPVHYEAQEFPGKESSGSVRRLSLKLEVDEEEKISTQTVNKLEAEIFTKDLSSRLKSEDGDFCFLYSRLNPSQFLIQELIRENIGFSAQFKFLQTEEPLITLFTLILKREFDPRAQKKVTTLIQKFCELLGLEIRPETVDKSLRDFDLNKTYWGFLLAFEKMIKSFSLSNENFDINLQLLRTIFQIFDQNLEEVYKHLMIHSDEKISLSLRYGDDAHRVLIMTAHASKGLQFKHVYLGGIYTNGRDLGERGLFGKLPQSSVWFKNHQKREKFKSPWFIHEIELMKHKNFSESKRLFYVACTRAEVSLSFMFLGDEISFSSPKNSWSRGLAYGETFGDAPLVIEEKEFGSKLVLQAHQESLPLYFLDPMGIFPYENRASELNLTPELSVTRLNDLVDCPRKYYLSQILKILPSEAYTGFRSSEEDDFLEDEIVVIKSSADRGTRLHETISHMIKRHLFLPRAIHDPQEKEILMWVKDLLEKLKPDYQLISEKTLKFKLFNFMISGTPDLILIPNSNGTAEIWDFKTGQDKESNHEKYFFQLQCYALALYELVLVEKNQDLVLKLIYLDEKKILTKTVTFSFVHENVFPIWQKQTRPWLTNLDHCGQCSYGDICPR